MTTAQHTYRMLDQETLWTTAQECHRRLRDAGVPHAIVGGIAVCLHGYRRSTVDVDLLVRSEDTAAIRGALEAAGYTWSDANREFIGQAGVPVQFLTCGERAGKDSEVSLPDPSLPASTQEIEGLPVLSLARLIEIKLACGLGDLRRLHRDLADVVELILVHGLSRSFARHLHKSLREPFRKLVLQARGTSGAKAD